LFYRLNLIAMDVPPLRERPGDVRILSCHFLRQCAERYSLPDKRLHEYTVRWFDQYGWPGNIRELENLIHREYVLSDDPELSIAAPAGLDVAAQPARHADAGDLPYRSAKLRAVHEFNRDYLTRLMRRSEGNVTRAAEIAGKERRALGKLLKRYSISRRDDRDLAD
jgi:DNA-binding NtrC family response regulator